MATDPQESKIKELLNQGKLALGQSDYEASVSKLGEACQLSDSVHGDLAPESGDAYFLYGRALLQYAIQQNTVFGESEKAPAAEPVASTGSARIQIGNEPEFVTDVEEAADGVSKDKNTENEKENDDDDDDDDEDEDEDEEGERTKAEDDFETAWDILDVARVIFEKSEESISQLKLADVLLCLGDVSLETEKFNEALPDYKRAIEIKQKWLESDNRQLAEAHYKYALALELSSDESHLAVPELKKAIGVLTKRIEFLQSQGAGKGKGKASDEVEVDEEAAKEIAEIKELIPDMEEKVEELSNRQNTQREAEAILKSLLSTQSAQPTLPSSVSVNDLTSMIKRKAQPAAEDSPAAKVPKLEKLEDSDSKNESQ